MLYWCFHNRDRVTIDTGDIKPRMSGLRSADHVQKVDTSDNRTLQHQFSSMAQNGNSFARFSMFEILDLLVGK
jgi:uncharacterized protein YlbG (UPF0298 family)